MSDTTETQPKNAPPVETPSGTNEPPATASLVLPDQVLPPNLFILPIHGPVIFPSLMAPLLVTEPRFVASVEEAISRQRFIGLLLVKEGSIGEQTKPENLYETGVVVKILKRLKMPDGSINLLVHSVKRFRATKVLSHHPHIVVESQYLDEDTHKDTEMDALSRMVISQVKRLSDTNPFFTEELRLAMINAPGPGTVADLVAFAMALPRHDAQMFLETLSVKERFEKLLIHLKREQDVADLQRKIQEDVNSKINTLQREFFLKEQLKVIRKELGMEEDGKSKSMRTFRERINEAKLSEEILKPVLEELERFETLSESSPEYNVSRTYLEMVCSLPWSAETEDQLDTQRARTILDEDHYGLEKVKNRIIEFLAVRKLLRDRPKNKSQDKKGSIICLVGPPGVGKTSIGKSIARTLGRKFYRFSLGGMRDEAEIKGHRRTYIGALPGKVIQAIKRAGSKNPVLMLDEIDKLGQSFQGDPASALLEVLDPEQNHAFVDHYLDLPFDLSQVIFVATANTLSTIPEPLMDRMEIIEIPGYTLEEKEKIATQYILPKVFKETGLKSGEVKIPQTALRKILRDYAREPGMRTLQQLVEKIARKAASKIVVQSGKKVSLVVEKENLKEWLGPQRFYNELAERITAPGVVVGLAWTAMGGDILFVEANDMPGTGQLKLTGQMGKVMEESANIAWSYVKKKLSEEPHWAESKFKERDIHLHIPAGAIPKDGPSAGITMASVLFSKLTGRTARQKTAMTGELSLTGKVLPVGGIKEKILAAKRAGIERIVLPELNRKDLSEIPQDVLKGLELHWVKHVEEVFPLVLEQKKKSFVFRKKSVNKGAQVWPLVR